MKAFRDGAVVGEFVGAVPQATVDAFLDKLLPNEVDNLVALGDEESLRRAVELEHDRVEAALPLARLLHARGENEEALELLRRIPGSFPADGLAAQIELENQHLPELEPVWKELGAGRVEPALDLLISALPGSGSRRDLLRRVVVGLLDGLRPDDAGDYRRRLASALY